MSAEVAKAFEEFLRTRRDHRDGLTARQQLWSAFEAGAQFALDRIRELTGLPQSAQETRPAPMMIECPKCHGTGGGVTRDGIALDCSTCKGTGGVPTANRGESL